MTRTRSCPECGGGPVKYVELRREFLVGRWKTEIDHECCVCEACGVEFYEPHQLELSQQKAANAVRARMGVGAKMVVRWERGTVLPSLAASRLIEVLDDVPVAVFRSLAKKRGVVPRRNGGREGAA